MKKHWYDYLWIVSLTYLILGFFHILFAWLGLLCFFIPLIISIVQGSKGYCNRYCGRVFRFVSIPKHLQWRPAYHSSAGRTVTISPNRPAARGFAPHSL